MHPASRNWAHISLFCSTTSILPAAGLYGVIAFCCTTYLKIVDCACNFRPNSWQCHCQTLQMANGSWRMLCDARGLLPCLIQHMFQKYRSVTKLSIHFHMTWLSNLRGADFRAQPMTQGLLGAHLLLVLAVAPALHPERVCQKCQLHEDEGRARASYWSVSCSFLRVRNCWPPQLLATRHKPV